MTLKEHESRKKEIRLALSDLRKSAKEAHYKDVKDSFKASTKLTDMSIQKQARLGAPRHMRKVDKGHHIELSHKDIRPNHNMMMALPKKIEAKV